MPPVTLTSPSEPLVANNSYMQAVPVSMNGQLPSYQEAKPLLPVPELPESSGLTEMYWRAWEIAWTNLTRPNSTNNLVSPYMKAVDRSVLSMWESGFVSLYGVYARRAFDFIGALDNFYAHQQDDGFIVREISTEDGRDLFCPFGPNSTGPNFLAWVEWRNYRATGDNGRLAKVFYPLMALHRWYRANRTWPTSMYWATGESSGLGNQPRVPDSQFHHRHWTWVDANMQAIIDCRVLEQIASQLEQPKLMQELADERASLIRLVNEHLWDEEASFYKDVDANGRFSGIKSIAAYWSLLDKSIVPAKRLDPFLRHLRETWAFKLNHRIPSQSADSEGYNPDTGNSFRGGVWPPLTYLVTRGLMNVGHSRLAHRIAINHLENMWEVYQHTDTFWENYAPEKAAPGAPSEKDFVGPSGISPITMLLENIIGIYADWPLRRVTWHRHLDTKADYGVRNYPFGPDGTFEIVGNKEQIVVTTDVPFTLNIQEDGFSMQTAVPAGTSEIDLT